jgi:energy-coupling factor transport system permease protein
VIRNPLAWCAWTIAALAATFMDRNPWLQGLLLLVLINVWLPYRRGRPLHVRLGLLLGAIPVLFSVALSRFGEHAIVSLPAIPIIGGRWTWEAALFGASSGVALLLTVLVFGVLQSTVRSADLISLLPPPLYRAGTAFALSVAFAPKTVASFHAIVEARQLRGQRSGWRSAPAVLLPLLLTTLEQALQYGESLDARGYGSRRRSRYRPIAWSVLDGITLLASSVALVLTLAAHAATYNPYIAIAPAAPSMLSVVALLLLAVPAFLAAIQGESHAADRD